jgi:phosphate transport system permease protein
MTPLTLFIFLSIILTLGYYFGRQRAFAVGTRTDGIRTMHSRPVYYGTLTALWTGIPALIIFFLWLFFEPYILMNLVVEIMPDSVSSLSPDRLNLLVNDIKNIISGNIVSGDVEPMMVEAANHYRSLRITSQAALAVTVLSMAFMGLTVMLWKITPTLRARNQVETVIKIVLVICSTFAIFTTIGIVISVLYESIRFFSQVSITEFLFGIQWSPQMAIRSDQVGSSGAFGAIPVFAGTALISAIALMVAVPIGLMSAIYLSEYARKRVRDAVKPMLEILAGIPTVVYGFFAALTVAPFIRDSGGFIGMDVSSESAMAAGLVMGIMIIPFVSSLSDDVINAVPQTLRDGAYALGATHSETIRQVVIPAALPGIVGSILLAVSRAIGETMIVVMAAGLAANLTLNPFKTVTTVTVQIVTLLVGDQEFDSPKTLAAFALGLVLFVVTLILNVIALYVVRKYREQYE